MQGRNALWTGLTTAAALVVAALLYWPGLAGPFVLDDVQNIVSPYVEAPDAEAILYAVTHNDSGSLGRGVSVLSFVLTGLQYGLDPWGYKFHNLLIHLGCGLLIFRLLYVSLPLMERRPVETRHALIAGSLAFCWLIHPLLVSTVLYAVQRMTQLASLFILLALLCYVEFRREDAGGRRQLLYGWVLFPFFLALAMLSKENGVLLPFYVLVFEVAVFRDRGLASLRRFDRRSLWLLAFVVLPLLAGGSYVLTHLSRFTDYSIRTFTLAERLLTEPQVLLYYMQSILLPRLRAMSLYQDDFPVTSTMDLGTVLVLGLFVTMAVISWRIRHRAPVWAFGLGWFFASHLLESTFLPLELVFEHRNYLAAAGLLLPPIHAAWTLKASAARWVLVPVVLLFALLTQARVREWSNEELLLTQAVADHPGSSRARVAYANFLFDAGQLEPGLEQLRAADVLEPRDAGTDLHLLVVMCVAGQKDNARMQEAEDTLRAHPVNPYVLNTFEALIKAVNAGSCSLISPPEIGRLLNAAFELPLNMRRGEFHGFLLRFRGLVTLMTGDYETGKAIFHEAYAISGHLEVLRELYTHELASGRYDEAEATLDFMESKSAARLGIDAHLIEELRAARSEALQEAAPVAPPAL